MENRIKQWQQKLDELSQMFRNEFGSVSSEKMNLKPAPESWSIAETIMHLYMTNGDYLKVFEKVNKGESTVPFLGKVPFIVKMFGNMIFKAVDPARKKKIKTMKPWNPSESKVEEDILDKFLEQQKWLSEAIGKTKPYLEKDLVISSPANRNIVYKLEKAIDIVVNHEERHLEQCREVLLAIGNQAPADSLGIEKPGK